MTINGKRMYLWRAVDCEGEVLDILVQSRRNKKAALKLIRKLLKNQGFVPDTIVTDKLPSYGAALKDLGLSKQHDFGGRKPHPGDQSIPPDEVMIERGGDMEHEQANQDAREHKMWSAGGVGRCQLAKLQSHYFR